MIFILSISVCLLVLIIERLVGINWDFHVDSVTYVESMEYFKFSYIDNIFEISNNLHYFVVALLGINGTIIYNILLTAIGNQILYSLVIKKMPLKFKFYLILYLFNPYKLHLSTTLLKDSAIIFFLILTLFTKNSLYGMLLGGIYRNAFIFYIILHDRFRRFYIYLFIFLVILYFYTIGFSSDGFEEHLTNNMTFRDFDLVPNFTQYGAVIGSILRIIIWPLITISGLFFFISPTMAYIPLFIGSVTFIFVYYKLKINIFDLLPAFILMAFFAMIVPGYTTYYRYIFPVFALLPYIIIINKLTFKNTKY